MIFGKPLTALGGGGLKPEITVTAKAGALLNLHYKDSTIILKSYQLGAEETQHTFVVNVSETAYVVEDVTNSASVEVLVDAVAQYSVDIEYKLWLYREGDECEDVTGGWSVDGWNFGQWTGINPVKEDDCLNFYTIGSHDNRNAGTQLPVSFDGYSVLKIDYSSNETAGEFFVTPTKVADDWVKNPKFEDTSSIRKVFTIDISDLSGSYYIGAMSWPYDFDYGIKLYQMWLE